MDYLFVSLHLTQALKFNMVRKYFYNGLLIFQDFKQNAKSSYHNISIFLEGDKTSTFTLLDAPKYHLLLATIPLQTASSSRTTTFESPLIECKTPCAVDFVKNKVGSKEDCNVDMGALRFNF